MAAFAPTRLLPSIKRVVLAEMEKVRRRHCRNRWVQKLPTECRLRRGNSRFQPGGVAESGRPAVAFDLLFMDFQDFIQR